MSTTLLNKIKKVIADFFRIFLVHYQWNKALFFMLSLAVSILSPTLTCEADPTAKEKMNEVDNAVRAVASDAKLIHLTGDDLSLSGQTSTWIYVYKSESKNKLYEYWYEDGSVKAKSTISQWGEFKPTIGMNFLPDNWLDSNEALNIAEANGGSAFRASHGGNAAIAMSLFPSAYNSTGDIPHLPPITAWSLSYRWQDTYFDIMINAQTGVILEFSRSTARGFYPYMDSLAKEIDPEAQLFEVFSPVSDLEGKTDEWAFHFQSISRQSTFICSARRGGIRRETEMHPPGHNYSPSISIPETWMDSDSAILIAESQGGQQFRASHPGWEIAAILRRQECSNLEWNIRYNSQTGSEEYFIQAQTGTEIINTAQAQLNDIRELAAGLSNDAQLVFVTSSHGNLSNTGSGEWHYVFKSVSQQKLYEFISNPNGTICLLEGVTSFFSKEDFLNLQPFPESWISADSALAMLDEYGGREFRENHPDWMLASYLFVDPGNGNFRWDFHYLSENTGQDLSLNMNARIQIKVLARQLLSRADSLAKDTDPGAELVYIHTPDIGLDGKANQWNFYYRSSNGQEIYQFYTDYGVMFTAEEFTAPIGKEAILAFDTFPSTWINSDYLIDIAEDLGGEQHRQEHSEYWVISAALSLRSGYSQPHWRVAYRPDNTVFNINALYPVLETDWQYTFGGENEETGFSVKQTNDGGFIIAGHTNSFGAGMSDTWLIKTDWQGNETWNKTFGGEFNDSGEYVEETAEDELLIAHNATFASEIHKGSLLITQADGTEKLRSDFGSGSNIQVKSVHKTTDNSYVMAGSTNVESEPRDFWLIKVDNEGNEVWNKTYGDAGDDHCESMLPTTDGGYILLGSTNSFGGGMYDLWLVKTDSDGNVEWDRTFGGSNDDEGRAVAFTSDGGYILAGFSQSFGDGSKDGYIVKTDSNGNGEWDNTFGREADEYFNDIIRTSSGNFVMVGGTTREGNGDIWIIKTDSLGREAWNRIIGGDMEDTGNALCETNDGDYVITGGTRSWGAGEMDVILVKVADPEVITSSHQQASDVNDISLRNYPNPFKDRTNISFLLNSAGKYKIRVIDLTGREVGVLLNKYLPKGRHEIKWDSKSSNGQSLYPGMYLLELSGNMRRQVSKMLLIK